MDIAGVFSNRRGRARYRAIVEAIADEIASGRLRPGDRLPVQRDLARILDVAVGTVTRAYVEAARLGLIAGEAGRGTYVRGLPASGTKARPAEPPPVDLTFNRLAYEDAHPAAAERMLAKAKARRPAQTGYGFELGPGAEHHRATAVQWLATRGVATAPEGVVLCNGIQHGLAVVLAALVGPGDVILTEELNYPGIGLLGSVFRPHLRALAVDAEGLSADALAAACRRARSRLLVCAPTLHNPTNGVMSLKRRQAVAEIARRHDLIVVEHDVNGIAFPEAPPSFTKLVPERAIHLASTWKSTPFGICIGFIAAPAPLVPRLTAAAQATSWMPAPFLTETVSGWIADGAAAAVDAWHRGEAAERSEIARRAISRACGLHRASYNAWLPLPDPWRRESFVDQLRRRGVIVMPSDAFVVGRATAPHAVRINLGGTRSRTDLRRALETVAEVLEEGPRPDRIIA